MTILRRIFLLTIVQIHLFACLSHAADVLVVADTRLKPVTDVISGMEKTLKVPMKIYPPSRVKGRLTAVAAEEEAKVVVALGKEALAETLLLPPSVLVIYDLVLIPPALGRPNTTGFYMATPVREYLDFISGHLRGLDRIAVVGSREQINILARSDSPRLSIHSVRNSFEFVSAINQLNGVDAVLLLPDLYLLTSTAMEEAYLFSFRNKIPLLGISEKSVKDGALFALVVDSVQVGKSIGEYAARALRGAGIGQIPPSPARKFELFLNLDTARKMGIQVPEEAVDRAKRIYR